MALDSVPLADGRPGGPRRCRRHEPGGKEPGTVCRSVAGDRLGGGSVHQFRSACLAAHTHNVIAAAEVLQDSRGVAPVLEVWEAALAAPQWAAEPVWMHGDLHPANLLVEDHHLSAVIDFGLLGVGDPACDLMVAWTYLFADSRDAFRGALEPDDATWARGRGWASISG